MKIVVGGRAVVKTTGKCSPLPKVELTQWAMYVVSVAYKMQYRVEIPLTVVPAKVLDEAALMLALPMDLWPTIPPFADDSSNPVCNGPDPVITAAIARAAADEVEAEAVNSEVFTKIGKIKVIGYAGTVMEHNIDWPTAAMRALRLVFGEEYPSPWDILADFANVSIKALTENRGMRTEALTAHALGLFQIYQGALVPTPKLSALISLAARKY